MFRYVGLVWDGRLPTVSVRACQLAQDLEHRPEWTAALQRSGLQVYVTGTSPGVNRVYPLPDNRGVVLGKLFRRSDLHAPLASDGGLNAEEGDDIVQSSGRAVVRAFWGRYVCFLCTEDGSVRVLRDPSGTLPCFRIRHQGVTIVFSWLEDVLEMLPAADAPHVNWEALKAFILLGALGGRETALDGVSQVLAGELLDLRTETSTLLWRGVDIARSPTAHSTDEAEVLLRDTVLAVMLQ